MAFERSRQPKMEADRRVELEGEDSNDVIYVEMRRQLLLLTADDDEDFHKGRPGNSFYAPKRSSSSLTTSACPPVLQPGSYFNWWKMEKSDTVPAWLVNLWRNGNGTGVFIPHITKSRGHYKSRRKKEERRTYKRVDNKYR